MCFNPFFLQSNNCLTTSFRVNTLINNRGVRMVLGGYTPNKMVQRMFEVRVAADL